MLPAGFKVNGSKIDNSSSIPIPPRIKKIVALLSQLPFGELLTSRELCMTVGLAMSGGIYNHPVADDYREKVDGKIFWGNKKTIIDLRKKLTEETNG